jgi:hypothetical protein
MMMMIHGCTTIWDVTENFRPIRFHILALRVTWRRIILLTVTIKMLIKWHFCGFINNISSYKLNYIITMGIRNMNVTSIKTHLSKSSCIGHWCVVCAHVCERQSQTSPHTNRMTDVGLSDDAVPTTNVIIMYYLLGNQWTLYK